MKVHLESRMSVYTDGVAQPHVIAFATEVVDIPENPTLADTAQVLTAVQHNSEMLYQGFVAESKQLPAVLANQQTHEVTREGLMSLISAIDASKIKLLESYTTKRIELDQPAWWCLKLGPVK